MAIVEVAQSDFVAGRLAPVCAVSGAAADAVLRVRATVAPTLAGSSVVVLRRVHPRFAAIVDAGAR